MRKFYAVRVTIVHEDGSSTCDYVRGESPMSKRQFDAYAIGNLYQHIMYERTNRKTEDDPWEIHLHGCESVIIREISKDEIR